MLTHPEPPERPGTIAIGQLRLSRHAQCAGTVWPIHELRASQLAVLADGERVIVWETFMRDVSSAREGLNLTKAELRAAVDATDAWIDSNQASFNTALPLAARTNLTAAQKTRLFTAVAERRFRVS